MSKKELSSLQRQILSGSGTVNLFTQQEFDDALTIAKAEIMSVAIETTKKAIIIEREECAKLVSENQDISAELRDKLAKDILTRMEKFKETQK